MAIRIAILLVVGLSLVFLLLKFGESTTIPELPGTAEEPKTEIGPDAHCRSWAARTPLSWPFVSAGPRALGPRRLIGERLVSAL